MTKYFFWIYLLLCISQISAIAQDDSNIAVELSEEYNIPAGTYLESILYSDQENIYLLRKNYPGGILSGGLGPKLKTIIIESYDRDKLKLQNAVEIDLKHQKKLRTFHEIFNVKGSLYLITSFFNSTKRKNYLFAQKLNSKFSPSDDLILIGEIDSRNESQTGDFLIKHSRDTSKIIIFHDLPTKRNENEQAKISVYDAGFQKIWDKKIHLPFESKLFDRIKFEVDTKGNAYLLGKHYFEKKKDSRKRLPNYEFIIEAYTENGEQNDKYQLNDKERFISDLTFEVNQKEQIICTGFFSNFKQNEGDLHNTNRWGSGGRAGSPIKGIVYFSINNKDKKIAKKKFTDFGLDFITMNESDRRKRTMQRKANDNNEKNDPGLFAYDFRDVILRSDGGAVIIAEQSYTYVQQNGLSDVTRFNNGGFSTVPNNNLSNNYISVFGDIIVVNINPDGSIQWANSVPKYQSQQDSNRPVTTGSFPVTNKREGFNSFASTNYRDKIQMIFNERVDFFESDTSAGSNLLKSRVNRYGLAMASVDKKGELNIQLVAANQEMGVQVLPKLIKQIDKKEIIFYGRSKGKFRIGKIILN